MHPSRSPHPEKHQVARIERSTRAPDRPPGVPQGAVCDQLADGPSPSRLRRVRANVGLAEIARRFGRKSHPATLKAAKSARDGDAGFSRTGLTLFPCLAEKPARVPFAGVGFLLSLRRLFALARRAIVRRLFPQRCGKVFHRVARLLRRRGPALLPAELDPRWIFAGGALDRRWIRSGSGRHSRWKRVGGALGKGGFPW